MKAHVRVERKLFVVIALLAVYPLSFIFEHTAARTCTIFTVAQDETVLFGNNEDWHSPDLLIGFYPASAAGYGSVHVGFRHPDGSIEFGGAMNDQGLAWDVNGLPRAALNPHPERRYSHATDNYLSTITKKAATVAEALRMVHDFDFGDSMALQIHVADASGDAAVISAGPDGEVAYTRRAAGDGYLVSTNFNLANPDNGTVGWRYDTAVSMLERLIRSQGLTPEDVGDILQAVHLENLASYTLYSNVFDLKNRNIYLYYLAQYNEVVRLNLSDELAKGERIVEMRDLFGADTVEAGQAAYKWFEVRGIGVRVAVVGAVLVLTGGVGVSVVRKLRRQRPQPA
jgi:hypothetical protein